MTHALRVRGYASLFDVADLSGDVVRRGAFAASLLRSAPHGVRMLLQHEPGEPVGVWDRVVEDRKGLAVEGRILDAGPRGRTAQRLVAAGALDGLSIGFRTTRARASPGGGRDLLEVDLWEVSLVTFPLLPQARLRPADLSPRSIAA